MSIKNVLGEQKLFERNVVLFLEHPLPAYSSTAAATKTTHERSQIEIEVSPTFNYVK